MGLQRRGSASFVISSNYDMVFLSRRDASGRLGAKRGNLRDDAPEKDGKVKDAICHFKNKVALTASRKISDAIANTCGECLRNNTISVPTLTLAHFPRPEFDLLWRFGKAWGRVSTRSFHPSTARRER